MAFRVRRREAGDGYGPGVREVLSRRESGADECDLLGEKWNLGDVWSAMPTEIQVFEGLRWTLVRRLRERPHEA